MILIKLERDNYNNIIHFSGDGHAEYANSGEDIVCAAVSAILQTAVFGLLSYLEVDLNIEVKDGWLYCDLDSKVAKDLRVKAILETMLIGLKETEKTYGEYLNIIEGGGKND
ncbi:ribosomal-processing cysteine protease Prp [Halonatronum saccharophilum]|uniref:ribosomal-processing cysteine protease Prp n=1 Tax=Halonatronum saccharophilum TaxID=150060 RepID=UPI00048293F1|nr:ribosomal-processing cysteine protease Prp [Halonatronum saccharophilum]